MNTLYNILIGLAEFSLPKIAIFKPRLKLFVEGRKKVFNKLKAEIGQNDRVVWFHAASLGEFEQAVPVIEMIKAEAPYSKILVTFFSPSGYENKKNHPLADVITYLPMDSSEKVKNFLNIVSPELVFFVKYEIWPNYLKELRKRKIRTFLISGVFRENQVYFKNYGGWMRKSLETFEHFFVQNEASEALLKKHNFDNVSISGDTRFDRVSRQIEYDNTLSFVEEFLQEKLCLVAGSTWPEDEELLLDYINSASEEIKFIIAPHEIKEEKILAFQKKLIKPSARYTENHQDLSGFDVLIIDTIGLLGKIYSYADVAYVGGAAGNSGLHNILEPATFGVPIVIGSNFSKFPEAIKLQQLAGLFSVATAAEASSVLQKLTSDNAFRRKTGMISGHFVNSNTGATAAIRNYLFNKNH
ncbi:glycosyltransferase N-terminal domain-containing protein [Salegentibacter sp. F188]|uniref:3-deoxy-D-manno-octulosonic acid transferase n=1 Tax=Autumnicola patrickiae TaxID=3075591 RepID=A0ABU3E1R1_9FLAO|nr:glycosyltransferase N-terminal domain-containing protein [Salegentibacter sp. F188]MDT0689202.1 glycosyltransferase N-terminal domain-containing protein [Salegentibacter sp. F188]